MDYFEWDGETHAGEELSVWIERNMPFEERQTINCFCDCFRLKGCCSLTVNDQKIRPGDRLYARDGRVEIERGDTPAFICPTHNIEHKGTGFYLCTTTGQHT